MPQLITSLAEARPRPEAVQALVDQLIQRLAAVNPGPGEAPALVKRLQHATSRASDRQRLREILEAEDAALALLSSWTPPRRPGHGPGRAKRHTPRGKRAGRGQRRSRTGGWPGRWCGTPSPCGHPSPCERWAVLSGAGAAMRHEQATQVQQRRDEGQSRDASVWGRRRGVRTPGGLSPACGQPMRVG
jgi:hypothetical protein